MKEYKNIYTKNVPVSFAIDNGSATFRCDCPFDPDEIRLKNLIWENSSTNGADVWMVKTDLINNADICFSVTTNPTFTNQDLIFPNQKRNIAGTYNISVIGFDGIVTHDVQIDMVLCLVFVEY